MLNSPDVLGINSPVLGKRNPLTKPLALYSLAERAFRQRQSKFAIAQLNQVHGLSLYPQLIQTARLLSTASPDRLDHSNQQSEIGWDNWHPIDRSSDRDDFSYKVDRSRFNIEDRSSQSSELESPALDFFTTILPTEFADINPQLDSVPTHPAEVEISASAQEPLLEMSIDLNLDVPESPIPDLTQISRFVVGGKPALQENPIAPSLAFPPELIPDQIFPNLLDPPTIINPVTFPKVTQSVGLSPAMFPPEQIAPDLVSSPRLPSELHVGGASPSREQSIDLLTVNLAYSQPPEVATLQPPLEQRSAAAENIAPVMPLAVEPVDESISDTLPLDLSDSPIINQPPSTDLAQISASLDELAIANLAVSALPSVLLSNLSPTNSPLSADRAQIATAPNQIAPEVQSPQPLSPATAQLNLAADPNNIDRDLDLSTQPETANLNVSESPSTLPASNPAQIATSATPVKIAADLKSTQLLNADISQLDQLAPTIINQASSGLKQISTFADEPTPESPKNLPIPIVESSDTLSAAALSLAESHLPWSIDPDLTIESIPSLSLDAPQFNIDRLLVENTSVESAGAIEIDRENILSKKSLASSHDDRSIINQPIANPPQNTNQLEYLPVDILDGLDDIISPIDNSASTIQLNRARIESSTIYQKELPLISIDGNDDNSADITIPAPTVGYATGGYVKDANHIDLQSIATSDTVSAMLTPGEFVINAKAAQENLDLLTHINSGGEPAAKLPNPEIQPSIIEPVSTSIDISPTSIQRKHNNSLTSPFLQQEISLQQLSQLINTGLDSAQSSQAESNNSSPTYSSPSMVFRKSIASPQPQYIGTDTPDQWGSIEDLMNGGSHNSDTFSFENISPQHPDVESRSSPRISPQYTSLTRGVAGSGEVTPSDISKTIAPITHTIESPISNPQQQPENNDPAELEILAREIYHRLRQRLEIERERHGSYSGNLPW
jgi:hypothetical protein